MQQNQQKREVTLYTGALCTGAPSGTGSWSAILQFGAHQKEMSGHQPDTTLERMELFSMISALGALKEPCAVHVHSSSQFLLSVLREKPLKDWMMSGWKRQGGEELPCKDLFMILFFQSRKHQLSFVPCKKDQLKDEEKQCLVLAQNALDEYVKINTPLTEETFKETYMKDLEDLPDDDELDELNEVF